MTVLKHLSVFFEQEKGHMKEDELGKFYFLEREGNQHRNGRWISRQMLAWVSNQHKLREIGLHVVLTLDETMTF